MPRSDTHCQPVDAHPSSPSCRYRLTRMSALSPCTRGPGAMTSAAVYQLQRARRALKPEEGARICRVCPGVSVTGPFDGALERPGAVWGDSISTESSDTIRSSIGWP